MFFISCILCFTTQKNLHEILPWQILKNWEGGDKILWKPQRALLLIKYKGLHIFGFKSDVYKIWGVNLSPPPWEGSQRTFFIKPADLHTLLTITGARRLPTCLPDPCPKPPRGSSLFQPPSNLTQLLPVIEKLAGNWNHPGPKRFPEQAPQGTLVQALAAQLDSQEAVVVRTNWRREHQAFHLGLLKDGQEGHRREI